MKWSIYFGLVSDNHQHQILKINCADHSVVNLKHKYNQKERKTLYKVHLLRQQQAAHCKNTYHAHSILYRHIDTLKHTHTQYLLLSTVYELEFICPLVALLNSFVLPQNFCVLIEFLKKEMYSHSFKFQSPNINSF